MDKKELGTKGEAIAKRYYMERGFEILESNYRYQRAEVDFIALAAEEQLLVFVEVKYRSGNDFGDAESFVSPKQQERIKEAAEDYIFGINWKKEVRFDIVSVDSSEAIEVFEDAF